MFPAKLERGLPSTSGWSPTSCQDPHPSWMAAWTTRSTSSMRSTRNSPATMSSGSKRSKKKQRKKTQLLLNNNLIQSEFNPYKYGFSPMTGLPVLTALQIYGECFYYKFLLAKHPSYNRILHVRALVGLLYRYIAPYRSRRVFCPSFSSCLSLAILPASVF